MFFISEITIQIGFFLPRFARTFPKPGAGTPLLQRHGAGGTRRPRALEQGGVTQQGRLSPAPVQCSDLLLTF